MPPPRIVRIERLKIGDRTACYFIRPGTRSRPWTWFEPDEVPPFDGECAWFEVTRRRGVWTFVREVEGR